MKLKMNKIYAALLALIVLSTPDPSACAQGKNKRKDAQNVIQVQSRVVNAAGDPVADAVIYAGEGAVTRYSDADGKFTVSAKSGSDLLIEAPGYKSILIPFRQNFPSSILLVEEPFLSGEKDQLDRADGGYVSVRNNVSAIGQVDVDRIRKYPGLNLSNAFQGQAAGLIARWQDGGLGEDASEFFVRGQMAANAPAIVVIDGIERSVDDILPEEIGSIEILKDAPAKVLYGARGANGVILINTKRGEPGKRIIRTTLEYGVTPVTRVPSWLGAYDYATLYNEASSNDGLPDYYLPYQMAGYAASTGENDVLYPEVDWYKRFTRNMGTYRKAVAEFIGGNRGVKYSLVTGYTGGSGLEKVADASQVNRFNVRGNLDIRINDFLTVAADVAARLHLKSWQGLTSSELYGAISVNRPNEYAFILDEAAIGMEPHEDGTPYYGASILRTSNLLVDMSYGGDKQERAINSQSDIGLKFDFDKYVSGLFADAFITFDNYNNVRQGMSRTWPTYAVDGYLDEAGQLQKRVTQVKLINQSDKINVLSEETRRQLGFRADAGWKGGAGANHFGAVAAFRYYKNEVLGANQDLVTTNATLRLNYDYAHRFLAELILGASGSNQFSDHRYVFTPTLSLGYVLSEAPYLKVKASAGRLGYNPNGNYLLYNTAWRLAGTYATGNNNNTNVYVTGLTRIGNPALKWVTSDEASFGFEGALLDNRLSLEAALFCMQRNNQITALTSRYSAVAGPYLPSFNYGSVRNQGFELALQWNDKAAGGAFRYQAGVNFTFTKNKVLALDELENIEPGRQAVGKPVSALFGLRSEGLFGKDVALEGHAPQLFGYYGAGDVAYKDVTADGMVDDRDMEMIGQSFPVGVLGAHADLHYKGWGLYMLFTGEFGASKLLNNNYYWNTEANAYSTFVQDRYHPANNPDGTLPRLTTTTGNNSYRASDLWIADAGWMRLKDVELSYTLDNRKSGSLFKTCKIFVRGANLFVLSGIKDLDPERLNAGVTDYPVMRTVTGGVTIGF